jgi:hypothetical protein
MRCEPLREPLHRTRSSASEHGLNLGTPPSGGFPRGSPRVPSGGTRRGGRYPRLVNATITTVLPQAALELVSSSAMAMLK